MKDLLLKTAQRTGIADAGKLARFFQEDKGVQRLDEAMLNCPYFTEDVVLKLFAAALEWP